jgi:hypothetical protein
VENGQTGVKIPAWFWVAAGLGLLWNVFGVVQFVQSIMSTKESLMTMGMTEAQAEIMKNYPLWMTVSFAVGTVGGTIANVFLLLRKKIATQIFAMSLVGYIVLYIGDITEGVFEALGMTQVIILTCVVVIAAGLLWMSKIFARRHVLT